MNKFRVVLNGLGKNIQQKMGDNPSKSPISLGYTTIYISITGETRTECLNIICRGNTRWALISFRFLEDHPRVIQSPTRYMACLKLGTPKVTT